ncbi:MAG TPA: hypothetical protein PK079_07555 [Leptospiraceae bacterium]|nr:hypothetical protein [Leptospiraceae bacterium]HMW05822.1 hypothetical protein [Leptospiraceae bacterium]HMX35603.1 hypothetical protein [Leptospiraceae bacterium]HMY33896.1 hypothetical protein [Leptospiraceae bacterium]HMZ65868.1 hypothetical protein [Leptospiraceae bacterium]
MELKEWTVYKDGMQYACSLNEKEFCFGATSGNPHGEWGSSCSIEEFLLGKNQDFVQNYFPDKLKEILEYAKTLKGQSKYKR